jgi:hypothetical protein
MTLTFRPRERILDYAVSLSVEELRHLSGLVGAKMGRPGRRSGAPALPAGPRSLARIAWNLPPHATDARLDDLARGAGRGDLLRHCAQPPRRSDGGAHTDGHRAA